MTPDELNEYNNLRSRRHELLKTTTDNKKEKHRIYDDLKKIGARLYELSGKMQYKA